MTRAEVIVVCARRYNGHELWTALGILQSRGHSFEVVSTAHVVKDELTFRPNKLERLVYDIDRDDLKEAAALVIISGNMKDTEAYWTDPHTQGLVQQASALNLTVAAICCSVPTIAPICKDVPVSFYPLIRSRQRLQKYGAILKNVAVTVDPLSKIATAENQMATEMWALEICNLLEGKPPQFTFTDSGFKPRGRQRRMDPDVMRIIQEDKDARISKQLQVK